MHWGSIPIEVGFAQTLPNLNRHPQVGNPTYIAARYNHIQALQILLAHGGDPFQFSTNGEDAVGIANRKNNMEAIIMLTVHIDKAGGRTAQRAPTF